MPGSGWRGLDLTTPCACCSSVIPTGSAYRHAKLVCASQALQVIWNKEMLAALCNIIALLASKRPGHGCRAQG
jgi:hypothetical protein